MPDIQVNMISVLIAAIANFFLGFFWFSILFKKTWALEMGFNPNEELPKKELFRSLGLAMIGYFLLAYVLAHQLAVWDSESWGLGVSQWSNLERIAQAAFFTWLGFFVPVLLNGVAWAKQSWKLFAINATYHLLALLIVSSIIIYLS